MTDALTFYKFRGLGERTLDILERGEMWHSHPSDLNDSWEFAVPFYVPLPAEELVKHARTRFTTEQASVQLLDKMMAFGGGTSIPISEDFTRRFLKASGEHVTLHLIALVHYLAAHGRSDHDIVKELNLDTDSPLRDRVERTLREAYAARQEAGQSLGVLSLARVWNERLMWTHYADAGRGICIGITLTPDDVRHAPSWPVLVEYSDVPPRIEVSELLDRQAVSDHGSRHRVLVALYATKHRSWSYENEVRFFTHEGNRTYPIAGRISEIIIGDRTPNEWTTKIYALSKRRHDVAVYKLIKNHLEWGYVRARMTD
jgi:hypothetical protein